MATRKSKTPQSNPAGPGPLHAILFDDLRAFRRFLDANFDTRMTEQEMAALKTLWQSRLCAGIVKRNSTSLWVYDDTELQAVADWRDEYPDVEFALLRASEIVQADPDVACLLTTFLTKGTDTMAVMKGITYPRKDGRVVVDFSNTAALGWPAAWSFPERWTFEFNRTRIHGFPVFEVGLLEVERLAVEEAA